jgi:hypothetical protein
MQNIVLGFDESDVECDIFRLEASNLLVGLVVDISKNGVLALEEDMLAGRPSKLLQDDIPVGSA